MRKIKLTESQLRRIVKRVISESENNDIVISDVELNEVNTSDKTITIDCLPEHDEHGNEDEVTYQLVYRYKFESSFSQGDYYQPSYYDADITFIPLKVYKIDAMNNEVIDSSKHNKELMSIFGDSSVQEWVGKNLAYEISQAEKNEGSDY